MHGIVHPKMKIQSALTLLWHAKCAYWPKSKEYFTQKISIVIISEIFCKMKVIGLNFVFLQNIFEHVLLKKESQILE